MVENRPVTIANTKVMTSSKQGKKCVMVAQHDFENPESHYHKYTFFYISDSHCIVSLEYLIKIAICFVEAEFVCELPCFTHD